MNVKNLVVGSVAAAFTALAVGLVGCNAGSGEIPLAKVPPPPAGFGEVKKSSKAPKGGSAEDAQKYYK